ISGLPRLRLPSRNWMIFLSIVGAWTAAVTYDRLEKKRMRQKWCRLVEGLAKEPLPSNMMDRRVTIVLGGPPADGVMTAREHFHEYVKPVLVSAGLDWDVVEGRREGDIRAGLAERVRKRRKMAGEAGTQGEEELQEDTEVLLDDLRNRMGTREWDGIAGDVVIGRHAWKEYVRGLHEGWLGPVDDPKPAKVEEVPASGDEASPTSDTSSSETPDSDTTSAEPNKEEEKPEEKSKEQPKRKQPDPFISPVEYPSAVLSPSCPPILGPSTPVSFPHLLGFFNFPIRIYRFLNKRHLADDIGRQVAAAALGVYRPYETTTSEFTSDPASEFYPPPTSTLPLDISSEDGDGTGNPSTQRRLGIDGEQKAILEHEEAEWHKSARKRDEDEPGKERVWIDDMVLDPRIAARMQRFVLSVEDEQRAKQIAEALSRERWQKVW
ncbi:hypothetical protein NA57DRAFT_18835, partial [Rhizodiscina lignyota]